MIELLVSLAVSLIGLAGMLSLHTAIANGNGSSVRAAEAVREAESAVEELRRNTLADLVAAYGELPIDADLGEVSGRNDLIYQRRLVVSAIDSAPQLFHIRVEVGWTDAGAEPGSDDGAHDHLVVLEVVRTRQEGL